MQKYYIACMKKRGNSDHVYILGLFTDLDKAKQAVLDEENARAGKYVGYCTEEKLNPDVEITDPQQDNIVYKTQDYARDGIDYAERVASKFEWMSYYASQHEYINTLMKTLNDIEFKVNDSEGQDFKLHSRLYKAKVLGVLEPILSNFQHKARLHKREAARNG